jgi:PPM family protein phosphatase
MGDTNHGEQLTCLTCGGLNNPHAERCARCGKPLIIPDLDFNLLAHVSARTSVGQVRKNNEDNLHLWAAEGVILALVADGMGGAAAGEEASRLAVETIEHDFTRPVLQASDLQLLPETELQERLSTAIRDANKVVYERSMKDVNLRGMGTTSTLALIRGNRLFVAHVGDSRAYVVENGSGAISQVTSDHSFVQALVESGHLSPDEARNHPLEHVLYRALGQSLDLDVDVYSKSLKAGDRIVLCSDGLSKHMTPEEIGVIVAKEASPDDATGKLIEKANERGGEDNISVVVILMEATPGSDSRLITI